MADFAKTRLMAVDVSMLLRALGLPPDTELANVFLAPEDSGRVMLRLVHEEFSPVPEGVRIPRVTAEFTTVTSEIRAGGTITATTFKGWR